LSLRPEQLQQHLDLATRRRAGIASAPHREQAGNDLHAIARLQPLFRQLGEAIPLARSDLGDTLVGDAAGSSPLITGLITLGKVRMSRQSCSTRTKM
jgi:hypothetical protein